MHGDIPLILLQINDALFPIGGYTQSFGLETYIQQEIVCDRATACDYVRQNLRYNLKYTELLALRLAFEYAQAGDVEGVMRLEQMVTAGKAPKEIRLASHKLGSRFVKTVYAMGAVKEQNVFAQYCERQQQPINHCIAYGVFCAAAGVEERTAMIAYLYAALAAAVTVCVKSVPLSQTDGQRIIYESYALLEQIVTETLLLTEADLCLSTPGFDIRCMQHEQLYSRLYMS
ncbi:urease accessory protein UreF [Sporomusa acidovorans]|uniref:Urease accessory protein UreF n=1 Tax=Sporomusa acidovorans (strain ATCC 49682 / DSM 3132 / Mol) TaxID=1123286 RepID=A0ABZ3J987_SPOA4|nr:urease accessory protein UreF [Sporomusa acidovorans]OZC16230.1 urease accessory protein UreF [Sporomusa acidovorans DSM 3132]SDE32015.1 urease accessory protein [Sporomusa acidovorans]